MKDYRIKITIRNDRLLSAIEGMGHSSVMSFCKKYSLPYVQTAGTVSGKIPPLKDDGDLTKICENLLSILGLDKEEAFTERQMEGFSRTSFETKMEEKQLVKLIDPVKNLEIRAIESDVSSKITEIMSNCLSPREEKVIRMRYGINPEKHCYTLEEIALKFQVTRERIRQIETRSLNKFRNIKNSRDLLNTGFYETFTSVNIKPEQIVEADFFGNVELEEKKKKIDYRNQMSKFMNKNYNELCSKIDKESVFSSNKKVQIHKWIRYVINKNSRMEEKYFLNFLGGTEVYAYNWMYYQVKDIRKQLKKTKGEIYERAERVMNKLRNRSYVYLSPNKYVSTYSKFIENKFVYYK